MIRHSRPQLEGRLELANYAVVKVALRCRTGKGGDVFLPVTTLVQTEKEIDHSPKVLEGVIFDLEQRALTGAAKYKLNAVEFIDPLLVPRSKI